MAKILIVIPTYNERENLPRLIPRLLKLNPNIQILVVDDNSPDGTGPWVKQFGENNPKVLLLQRPKKLGIGTAYISGFKYAIKHNFDYILTMDGDLSHQPRYIPKFLNAVKKYDLVIGSRWIKGGRVTHWKFHRVLLSYFANLFVRWMLGKKIGDWTSGFNCYNRLVLKAIPLDEIRADGYSFLIEMKYRVLKKGFRITEIPITFTDRIAGRSKISRRIIFEAFFIVLFLKFGSLSRQEI